MKKIITLVVLASFLFVGVTNAQMKNIFRVYTGTGIGFPGFKKFNGGAYKTPDANYDYKYKPLYYTIGTTFSTANKKLEAGVEYGKMNWESKVRHPDNINHGGLYNNSNISMVFFDINMKYIPDFDLGKFRPYAKGSFLSNVYTTTSERGYIDGYGTPVNDIAANAAFTLNLLVGTYYAINKHFFAFGEAGIGWNLTKFGIGYQLGGADD